MKILIVDDQPAIRTLLERALTRHGFTAVPAATLGDAIATARGDDFQAVVLDLVLGDRSGMDFLVWLRADARHAAVPVLVFTGAPLAPDDDELIHRGHACVLHKPAHVSDMIRTLERLVTASAAPPPARS